jgi:hypothetical protein
VELQQGNRLAITAASGVDLPSRDKHRSSTFQACLSSALFSRAGLSDIWWQVQWRFSASCSLRYGSPIVPASMPTRSPEHATSEALTRSC